MSTTKIMYLRDSARRPFGCLAMKVDKANKLVNYQFSVVHPKDSFDKGIARAIASGRLDKEPLNVNFDGESTHDIVKAVMEDMLSPYITFTPQKAKKFARQWLSKVKV